MTPRKTLRVRKPQNRPPRIRRPRRSEDARITTLRARAVAITAGAAFGAEHPAVVHTIEHLQGQANAWTARKKADSIVHFLDWCCTHGFDPFVLRRAQAKIYYNTLPSTLARSTRHNRVSAIRSWYIDANEATLSTANPFYRVGPKNIDPRNPTPYITLEQVDRVMACQLDRLERGAASPADHRDMVLFYVMTRVGPRRFEAAAARWSTLEELAGVVRWALHGKGDDDARTTLPADVVEMLEAWRVQLATLIDRPVRDDDAIFPVLHKGAAAIVANAATGPLVCLAATTVGTIYKRALEDVGITGKRYAAHVARATAATLAYRNGATDREIQRMLRHRLLATTHRYIKLLEDTESPAESWKPLRRIDFSKDAIAGRMSDTGTRVRPTIPGVVDVSGRLPGPGTEHESGNTFRVDDDEGFAGSSARILRPNDSGPRSAALVEPTY